MVPPEKMDILEESVTTASRIRLWIRWALGLWLIYLCVRGLSSIKPEGHMETFASSLFAFAKGIMGVILIAPSLANYAARPILNWIDSIYLPSDEESKPPLDYKLPDYYRKTRQTDLAIERYAEIIRYYPKEATAYAWLYVLVGKKDPKEAKRILNRAHRRLYRTSGWERFREIVRSERARS
jgi:hypothetical protein